MPNDAPITQRDIDLFKNMVNRFETHLPVVIEAYQRGHQDELRRHQDHPLYERIMKVGWGHWFNPLNHIQFDGDEISSWQYYDYEDASNETISYEVLLMSETDAYEAGVKDVRDSLNRVVAQEAQWAADRAKAADRHKAHTARTAVASAAKTAYKEQRRAARMAAQN